MRGVFVLSRFGEGLAEFRACPGRGELVRPDSWFGRDRPLETMKRGIGGGDEKKENVRVRRRSGFGKADSSPLFLCQKLNQAGVTDRKQVRRKIQIHCMLSRWVNAERLGVRWVR